MDDRLRVFLWLVGGGGFFALLGGAFGALTGAVHWRNGKASGTSVGLAVARAFAQSSDRELSRGAQGAIVGGVDGFLFLGLLGVLIGGLAAYSGKVRPAHVGMVTLAAILLAGGALLFGGLAFTMTRGGTRGIAAVFAMAAIGAFTGFYLAGPHGLMIGVISGALLGSAVTLTPRRLPPPLDWDEKDDPDAGDSSTDITSRPDHFGE